MKLIFLLFLIACGKNQEPKFLDLKDDDGDQFLNYEERDLEKYIANYELKKVKGLIRFTTNEIIEIPFSTHANLKEKILKTAVKNDDLSFEEEYFIEWNKLELDYKKDYQFRANHYSLQLKFDSGNFVNGDIALVKDKVVTSLGKMNQTMHLQLRASDLEAILKGTAYLAVRTKFFRSPLFDKDSDSTIKEKTYRVYFSDERSSRILYITKSLSFDSLKELLKIHHVVPLSDDFLFFNNKDDISLKWYSREFSNGDKALVLTNLNELREVFFKNFTIKKVMLSRENGYPLSPLRLNNRSLGKVYLRISNFKQQRRNFVEVKEVRKHGYSGMGGRDGNGKDEWKCTHYLRKINLEQEHWQNLQYLFENLEIKSHLDSPKLYQWNNATILEQYNEDGPYWEIKLNQLPENQFIIFSPLDDSTFTTTGEYNNTCGGNANRGRDPAFKTNSEGKLSLIVESFVEKTE